MFHVLAILLTVAAMLAHSIVGCRCHCEQLIGNCRAAVAAQERQPVTTEGTVGDEHEHAALAMNSVTDADCGHGDHDHGPVDCDHASCTFITTSGVPTLNLDAPLWYSPTLAVDSMLDSSVVGRQVLAFVDRALLLPAPDHALTGVWLV